MENFKTGVVLAVAILIISLRYEAESKSLESPQEKRAKLRQSVESEELGNNPGTPQNDAIDQKSREAGVAGWLLGLADLWEKVFGRKEKTDQMKRFLRLSMDPGTPQNDAVDQKRLLRLSMDPGTPQNDAVEQKRIKLRQSVESEDLGDNPGIHQNDIEEKTRQRDAMGLQDLSKTRAKEDEKSVVYEA